MDKSTDRPDTRHFEYNRVPYPGAADGLIQLRNLEVVGHLFGLNPAPAEQCRVLELGCADGANLLPSADEFPRSQFVGVDLAAQRIAEACEVAEATGLKNIQFHAANLSDVDASFGEFDYIFCPGVFSWITPDERNSLLRICSENLAADGLAAISYNVFPGWHFRASVREFIRRHVRAFDDPVRQIQEARRAVAFMVSATRQGSAEHQSYAELEELLRTVSDHYLYHDYISPQNQPFYFHEVVPMAAANNLQFVAECDIRHTTALGLPESARSVVDSSPVPDREQLIDFVMNTSYRRSALCHAGKRVSRRLDHTSMRGMSIALQLSFADVEFDPADQEPLTLPYEGGTLTTAEPLGKAALHYLMNVWPQSAAIDDIYAAACDRLPPELQVPVVDTTATDGAAVLARSMLAAYAAGLVQIFRTPPRVAAGVSERPCATRLARHMATVGRNVVNQWHQNLGSLTAEERFVLSQLDGSKTVSQLEDELRRYTTETKPASDAPSATQIIGRFARESLLLIR